jgi:hypothetical protein
MNSNSFYEAIRNLIPFRYFNEEAINLIFMMYKKVPDFFVDFEIIEQIFEALIINDQAKELFIDFEEVKHFFETRLYQSNPALSPEDNLALEDKFKEKLFGYKKELYSLMFNLCVKYNLKSYVGMLFSEMMSVNLFSTKKDVLNMIKYTHKDRNLFSSTVSYIETTMNVAENSSIVFLDEEIEVILKIMIDTAKENRRMFYKIFKIIFGKNKSVINDKFFVECIKFFYISEDFKSFEIFLSRVESQTTYKRVRLSPINKAIALKVCSKCKDDSVRFILISTLDKIFAIEKITEQEKDGQLTQEVFDVMQAKTQAILESRIEFTPFTLKEIKTKNKPKPNRPIKDRRNALTVIFETMHDKFEAKQMEKLKLEAEKDKSTEASKPSA